MEQFLLETDQIRCYAPDGSEITCRGSGQDAEKEKTAPLLSHGRFQEKGRVIRDRATGAIWTKDANPADFPLSWSEAAEFTAEMRHRRAHGYERWHLPTRRLLFSLISHQQKNPCLPEGHPFEDVFPGYYWTSETCRRLPDQAWYGHMGGGRIHRGMKHGSYMVWPVSLPNETSPHRDTRKQGRFTLDGGAVHDTWTGRTWLRDADIAGGLLSWSEALSTVRELNRDRSDGAPAWRLPNIRELESLVDIGSHSPALPSGHPFIHVREAYWSSTTSVYETRYAWTLYSRDGYIGVGFKPREDFHAWPVRSP
jgi:hypothetical protein